MRKASFVFLHTLAILLVFSLMNAKAKANDTAFCSAYAHSSVLAHIDNIKSACGFKGRLWSPALRVHQSWCLDNTQPLVNQNLLLRKRQLDNCGNVLQRNLKWDEMAYGVQNTLFGELINAIAMDDLDSLKLFESQGVDLNFEWHLVDGGLLYRAISNQSSNVTRYLIENKSANPNLTSNGGPNPLVKLLNNYPTINYRLLDYLLLKGTHVNHGGEDYSDDRFPLATAVSNNDLKSVSTLLKYRANPNLYESVPPLMVAVYRNNLSIVELLLNAGANPNKGLNGLSCQDIFKGHLTGDLLAMDAAIASANQAIINTLSRFTAKTTLQCSNEH